MYRKTPQKVQKIIHNIIIPHNILFIFLTPAPPPKKKNEIQNFEPPKVDLTYLYMIILEYQPNPLPQPPQPPPPQPPSTESWPLILEKYAPKYSCLSACFSVNQSVSQPVPTTV